MKRSIALLLLVFLLTGCSSTPAPVQDTSEAEKESLQSFHSEIGMTSSMPTEGTSVMPSAESQESSASDSQLPEDVPPSETAEPTESTKPTEVVPPPTQPTEAPTSPPTESPTVTPTLPPTEPPEPEVVRWDTESAVAGLCAQVNAYAESIGLVVDPSCSSWSQPGCTNGVDQAWKLNSALEYVDYLAGFAGTAHIYCTYSWCPDCNDGWLIWIYY